MPTKKECYTLPHKKDGVKTGGTYTTCVEGQAKPKTKMLVKKYPKKVEPVKVNMKVNLFGDDSSSDDDDDSDSDDS